MEYASNFKNALEAIRQEGRYRVFCLLYTSPSPRD